ncbi:MAG TPA: IS5 family transposase [Phormidium sp.]
MTNSQWEVIEKMVDTGRKRKHSLRKVVDGLLKLTRSGVQWRNLEETPTIYPAWESLYYYFQKWQKQGLWGEILTLLVRAERKTIGKQEQASAVAVDSQSIKKSSLISLDTGIDGNKNVNGRKRHLAVDTLGLPLVLHVAAANKPDGTEGLELLWQLNKATSRLELIRADGAYKGEFTKYASYYHYQVEISQKPESVQGFVPQKGRWQVERSFAWLNFFRRLSKDYEKTIESSLTFMQLAFIDIILARMPK